MVPPPRLDQLGRVETGSRTPPSLPLVIPVTDEDELGAAVPFGAYVLVRKLATGQLSDVYLGVQGFAGEVMRPVIVKKILLPRANREEAMRRFAREIELSNMIKHAGIAPLYEAGELDGTCFVVTAYVLGESLADLGQLCRNTSRAIPEQVAARIVADACAPIDQLHRARTNAAHLDLTPRTILVGYDGHVQLGDTGLGKLNDGAHEMRWFSMEKARYRSPEMRQGRAIDHRADVYALGAILWELVTASTFPGLLAEEEKPRLLLGLNPFISIELQEIILSSISADPAHRFHSAAAMRRALESFIAHREGHLLGSDRIDRFIHPILYTRAQAKRSMLDRAVDLAQPLL
jgi:eukaryotic-like serine/threonine-protein kinase